MVCLLPLWLYGQITISGGDLSYAASKALPAVVRVQSFISDSLHGVHPELAALKGIKPSVSGESLLAGNASGVLISSDGYIITNAHILNGGDSLSVILPDRRAYRAILAGIDNATDLALLKIPEKGLNFLELADPSLVNIGDPVLAIGNPLDLASTVTAGILSARFRALDGPIASTMVDSYLQTDAASNEGMSGSALVNRKGELIGINSAIVSATGTFAGYAFAIPAGLVKKAWYDLIAYGKVRHAYLDASFRDMDDSQARRLGTSKADGVRVDSVQQNGSGERAGLHKDDVIRRVDLQQINTAPQLREVLALHMPGDRIRLTIARGLNEFELIAVLSAGNTDESVNNRFRWRGVLPALRTNGVH